jgi:hypothetical protein
VDISKFGHTFLDNWSYPLDDNNISDIHEILMSLGMNIIVAAGFIADFIDYRKDKLNNK